MPGEPNVIYRLLHKDYAETFRAYSFQNKDFYDLVCSLIPEGWNLQRRDMWLYCSPIGHSVRAQGWKIHVSASSGNAREVLEKVASVLFKYKDVSFKFALDCSLLALVNSKIWPRGASGKFITIYPADTSRFVELIEEVTNATAGMQGPYILSDQRYRDSRVVFYRYGGMRTQTALSLEGERLPVITSPSGAPVPDPRLAYPVIPSWEMPVLSGKDNGTANDDTVRLHDGRYTVNSAVAFSSAGGVYFARDNRTRQKVVIKEARPCINATPDGYDAIELLKKEYRLLGVLSDTGIAPRPVELFQEWEHWFLVEDFIEGNSMSHHAAANSVLLRTRATPHDCTEWCAMFMRLGRELVRILTVVHSRRIIFADLSTNNLIVTADGQQLKIIDFEGAHQFGIDRPSNIYTPGYLSRHRVAGGQARWEDDYYSAGAVLLAYLLPINGLLHLNPQARRHFLRSIREDIGLPESVTDFINNLMDHAGPDRSVEALQSPPESNGCLPEEKHLHNYETIIDDIVTHLNGVADYSRKDRLYPADPKVFSTNPLSLAYGATGVVYALHQITGAVPETAINWILQQQVTTAEYPPGLYIGMAGIAWVFLEIGMSEKAEEIFQATFCHPMLYQAADLFHGTAGWGMTALRFFQSTGKESYLKKAIEAGNVLLRTHQVSDRGYYWTAGPYEFALGLGHGSSGIGLFLLYLYLATREEAYLAAGKQALDFDLAAGIRTCDGGLSWGQSLQSSSPVYPYWRFGSAGIGIVTARFQRLLASPYYQSILEEIFVDTDRKYSVVPGLFTGLAGLSEFLFDMHDLTGEERFLQSANRVAEGIMHFRVNRNGTAFPGELTSRLCCDYGTGSAGIALVLNRLTGKPKSGFMLDGLFSDSCKHTTDNQARKISARAAAA
ncbi:MAG TPA: class III lanthionine synthetase LanKC [Candidatus Angelobacter sp.]